MRLFGGKIMAPDPNIIVSAAKANHWFSHLTAIVANMADTFGSALNVSECPQWLTERIAIRLYPNFLILAADFMKLQLITAFFLLTTVIAAHSPTKS